MIKRDIFAALMICLLAGILLVVVESASGKEDLGAERIEINTSPVTTTTLAASLVGISALTPVGDQIWHQDSPGIEDRAEGSDNPDLDPDNFGNSVAEGDFNNDGYMDLAIGVPGEDIGSIGDAGAVNVIYGSAGGLTSTNDQFWHQDSAGIEGMAEAGDYFGSSVAAGDFNDDGYSDLAIGVPWEAIGSLVGAGAVNVIYGSASGLNSTNDQIWHQDSAGIEDLAEVGDNFGSSVAAGDFNNDGYMDLAIGAHGEEVGRIDDAGAVNVIYGSASGLNSTNDQIWHQDSAGIDGSAEDSDNFGNSVAVGDFNDDGYSDLAISVPWENIGSIIDAGAVNVIYGSATGLSSTNDQFWHQDSAGIEGMAEADDHFGSSVAAGDFNDDGYSDLVIGVPWEDIGSIRGAGAVNVIYGSAGGLSSTNDQIWHQDSAGIEGMAEIGDSFGNSLAVGDFNNNGYIDLAIGVHGEEVGRIDDAGAVNVIYGSAGGLSSTNDQIWHQDSAGIEGMAEAGDYFGSSVAAGDFNNNGYTDLAIGVPGEDIGAIAGAGAVNVIYSQ